MLVVEFVRQDSLDQTDIAAYEGCVAEPGLPGIGGLMGLSAVAGFRADWFWLGMYMTACAVTTVVWTGVSTMAAIGARLTRLEQLATGTPKTENA